MPLGLLWALHAFFGSSLARASARPPHHLLLPPSLIPVPPSSHHSPRQTHTQSPNTQIKHDGVEVRTTPSTRPGVLWDDSRLSL
jgi:hypothetical protein